MANDEGRDLAQADNDDQLVPYETRFKPLNTDPVQMLPYALAAINTLGKGSVVAVGAKGDPLRGLQLTLPVNMMHNILSVLDEYDAAANLPSFPTSVIYAGTISHKTNQPGDLKPFVDAMNLIPPDMSIVYSQFYVVVAGPASREPYYSAHIKPELEKLVKTAP